MNETAVSVHTIPAGVSFVDALAAGVLKQIGSDPEQLADSIILLSTRRGCRALREAFLRHGKGRSMLLPRMLPLGDLDEEELFLSSAEFSEWFEQTSTVELAPAISPLRRQLLLARLVQGFEKTRSTSDRAVSLATELARLLDQVQSQQLDFSHLTDLVPEELSDHWQMTLEFLRLVTKHWPEVLKDEAALDPVERRNHLLIAQVKKWTLQPPDSWVIAAGSTGSLPATADLLSCVATLPKGHLILPGLDKTADDATWDALDPTHPQWSMACLLKRLGVHRHDVSDWHSPGVEVSSSARTQLINNALRPAAITDTWRDLPETPAQALHGISRLDCPSLQEEATAIALMMRKTLDKPKRTAALITSDRTLARRVTAELNRWEIDIDDSAGQLLSCTESCVFLRLIAAMVIDNFVPISLLAALNHPLTTCGLAPDTFRAAVQHFEIIALRCPRPAAGLQGLQAIAGSNNDLLSRLVTRTEYFTELVSKETCDLRTLFHAHIKMAEALAETDNKPGAERLWRGESGEALANFATELDEAADVLSSVPGHQYLALLESLMGNRVIRSSYRRHSRLAIWGPLEARMQQADLVILGSLNEGTWPPEVSPSPWMSRPMMDAFGLPSPEHRIGLSAHDFVQAFCAPRVVLTRSQRIEGAPTIPARWLLRLDAFLRSTNTHACLPIDTRWLDWQEMLDSPKTFKRTARPCPCPPVNIRPRRLSVTQIETWMRDPYGIYARHILGLKALEDLDAGLSVADYGNCIHKILETFISIYPPPTPLPDNAKEQLSHIGQKIFSKMFVQPSIWAFWWPRFERISHWFVNQEIELRIQGIRHSFTEIYGSMRLAGPAGDFEIHAKADRINVLSDDQLAIIDYKTGIVPSSWEISSGFAPQLPLEGVIAQSGGFKNVSAAKVNHFDYWRLNGGQPVAGKRRRVESEEELMSEAVNGLRRLISVYDSEETPYLAVPQPSAAPKYNDYEHLARIREWASIELEDNE